MRTTIAQVSVALAALVYCGFADAQTADRTGFGLSGSVGVSQIRDKDGNDEFSGNGFGLSVDVEYRFHENFALGFGGFSLGEAEDDFGGIDTSISVRGWDIYGRLVAPVSDTTELYARIGHAQYFVDIDPGSVDFFDALFGDDAFEFGVGLDMGRKNSLAFRIEARFFNGGDDETGLLLTLGVNNLF